MADLRIRQLVMAANSLDTANTLQEIFDLGRPYNDPGVGEFGLTNAVFAIGDQFLEVVVPVSPDAPARRFIDRFGECGYMVIFQVANIEATRNRADALNIRRVWNADLEEISASHFHPADFGGAIVSVDQPRPASSWRWGGPDWEACSVPGELTGAVIASPTPEEIASRWANVLDAELTTALELPTREGAVYFLKSEHSGVPEFQIKLDHKERILERAERAGCAVYSSGFDIAGVRFALI